MRVALTQCAAMSTFFTSLGGFGRTFGTTMNAEIQKVLTDEMGRRDVGGIEIMGPAPAFVHRVKTGYRWQLVLRGTAISDFLSEVRFPKGWAVDIDPVSLL